jgi:hypothetical protein
LGVSAIYGLPGRGKSLFSIYLGFFLAERYQKALVTNFPLKPLAAARYCQIMGYSWLSQNFNKGIIFYTDTRGKNDNLLNIFLIKDSVILWDEVGSDLPSRGAIYNTPRKLLESLYQVRHSGQYLFVIAQSELQIDFALRSLVEEIFHCDAFLSYSPVLRNEAIDFRFVYRFMPDAYQVYLSDPKVRKNPLKSRILSNKCWQGWLNCLDGFCFSVYESFSRLSEQKPESVNLLFYDNVSDLPIKRIVGEKNPFASPHRLSWLIKKLMNFFPYPFLDRLLALDVRLSKFKGFNNLEKLILWFLIPFSLLVSFKILSFLLGIFAVFIFVFVFVLLSFFLLFV